MSFEKSSFLREADMFICPVCKAGLPPSLPQAAEPLCNSCGFGFPRVNGYLSLSHEEDCAGEYGDVKEDARFLENEDGTTAERFERYFLPLFRSSGLDPDSRILSIGCGGGADVDCLRKNGFANVFGVDMEWRSCWWKSRLRDSGHLFIANGKGLPFQDNSFDLAFSLGVIEHVGAVGSSAELYGDYKEQRVRFLKEALRVLKADGRLIIACPNRTFPVDFQHNISRTRLFSRLAVKTGISFHSPFDPFLLSYKDIKKTAAALPVAGVSNLPVNNYLGLTFRNSPMLKPLKAIFKAYLGAIDRLPGQLSATFINPYMICVLHKDAAGVRAGSEKAPPAGGLSPA